MNGHTAPWVRWLQPSSPGPDQSEPRRPDEPGNLTLQVARKRGEGQWPIRPRRITISVTGDGRREGPGRPGEHASLAGWDYGSGRKSRTSAPLATDQVRASLKTISQGQQAQKRIQLRGCPADSLVDSSTSFRHSGFARPTNSLWRSPFS